MDPADRKKAWRILCTCVGLILTTNLLDAGEAGVPSKCDERCILVETTTVRSETYAPKITLTGSIQPKFSSKIAFRVSGKIAQRLAEIGDRVNADQVLALLDPQEQQANLDTVTAVLSSAQALLTQAKTTFDRQSTLFKSGYTTRPAFDQAQQQLRTQTAAVESAKAALGSVKEQLGYTSLRAGITGIITGRNAETGQVVQPGQTVFTLAQDGPRDAVFDVYEALQSQSPSNRAVTVYLQSDQNVSTSGDVREISPTVDAESGTVKVKVELTSVPADMSLGATVVGVGSFKAIHAIVLPRGALFRWHDAPAVWLLDPNSNSVMPKIVTIERFTGDQLVLSSGVSPGDVVVTAGIQFLHPGQVVGVVTSDLAQ